MRVWIVSFGLLFVIIELLDWLQGIEIPLPVFGVAGIALAIASNRDSLTAFPETPSQASPEELSPPQPPTTTLQPKKSISFKIRGKDSPTT
ncbi:hypothetical protein PN462_03455 [Spirulina sp. CS-785/01]|uniref:hypothetical protein n=1 Tax=Spirulina sp. CS-785/01 TaxID=3021716 RepID=UPI00232AF839|nr:hypothetical protein [Spirulina sp. CS-785/01]MDB9312146.1 hypothetical protein [Spirulina sp. CS-785/01]